MLWRKSKPAEEEAERSIIEIRYLCGLSNGVEIGVSVIVKGIGLVEQETVEREEHSGGFSFRFIEAVRAFRQVIRRWWVHSFAVIRLKPSGREMMEELLHS